MKAIDWPTLLSLLARRPPLRLFLVAICLCGPVFIWYGDLLGAGGIMTGDDILAYFYPLTVAGMKQWRAGQVPLWTTNLQSGFPLLADGQGALLYPITLAMHWLLPAPMAYNWCIFWPVILSAALMYAFVRCLGAGRRAAVAGGWLYVFAGPVADNIGSPALNGVVWWPLLFLLAERLTRRPGLKLAAAAGAVMGLGWLGGFPQTKLYGITAASAYLAFRSWPTGRSWRPAFFAPLVWWGAATLLGIGLGAVQLIPTLEMSAGSVRAGGVDFALAAQGSMFPAGLAGFLLPGWRRLAAHGWLAGPNIYIGVLALAMAGLTLRRNRDRRLWFFWLLIAAGCCLSLGKFNPLYRLVYALPGFNFLRVPARFMYWTVFGLSVLSCLGLDRLLTAFRPVDEIRRCLSWLKALAGILLVGTLLGSLALRLGHGLVMDLAAAYANRGLVGQAYRLQNADYYQARIDRMYSAIAAALDVGQVEVLGPLILSAAAIFLLTLWLRRPASAVWARNMLVVLVAADLAVLAGSPLAVGQAAVLDPPPPARWLAGQSGLFRLHHVVTQADIVGGAPVYDRLPPNYNLLHGIAHTGVYSALGSRRYYELLGELGGVNLGFGYPPTDSAALGRLRPVLNLINARFVVSCTPLRLPGLEPVAGDWPCLYVNAQALPRAFVVPAARVFTDTTALLQALHAPDFDPAAVVLLETPPAIEVTAGKPAPAHISSYTEQSVVIQAEGPGWLVLTDLYYPGWEATVDSLPAPIYRGDYVFRALPLTPGLHHVEFHYRPRSFWYGAALTGLSALVALVLILTVCWPRTNVAGA